MEKKEGKVAQFVSTYDLLFATPGRDQHTHTWHTNAAESPTFVEASAVVLARIRVAFVDVDFTARPGKTTSAITTEGARSIDA